MSFCQLVKCPFLYTNATKVEFAIKPESDPQKFNVIPSALLDGLFARASPFVLILFAHHSKKRVPRSRVSASLQVNRVHPGMNHTVSGACETP